MDEEYRISKIIIDKLDIPIDDECWLRSGVDNCTLQNQVNKYAKGWDDSFEVIRMLTLNSYLVELFVDEKITYEELENITDTYLKTDLKNNNKQTDRTLFTRIVKKYDDLLDEMESKNLNNLPKQRKAELKEYTYKHLLPLIKNLD